MTAIDQKFHEHPKLPQQAKYMIKYSLTQQGMPTNNNQQGEEQKIGFGVTKTLR